MKVFFRICVLVGICSSSFAFSSTIDGISVNKIEIYSDKTKISDLGTGGASIPLNTKIIVVRTNNPTYAGWRFVSYGNATNETLSILLTAKAMNKTVSCVWEDRGNFWVECVGLIIN